MFREVHDIIEKELLEKPYYINIVLGMRYQGACDATPMILNTMIDYFTDDAIFNCTAVGLDQLSITTLATLLCGCVRVGLEDNIYCRKGELASNAQLVTRTVQIAKELGKEPAPPNEAREILGLKPLQG